MEPNPDVATPIDFLLPSAVFRYSETPVRKYAILYGTPWPLGNFERSSSSVLTESGNFEGSFIEKVETKYKNNVITNVICNYIYVYVIII
jgi:hypothetical protein